MSWRDRQVTASFRGFKILTDSHDSKGGRRLAVKEMPGAEQPQVSDLGGKADEFHLNAYFVGADYDLFRDKFLLLLNKPGAGILMHPWRGALWVRAHNWSVHESNDKGGFCTVAVDFVPGGTFQIPLIDRTDQARAAIVKHASEADKQFIPPTLPDTAMQSFIKQVNGRMSDMRNMIAMAGLPLTMLSQARNAIDGIKTDAAMLLALPAQYAAALGSLANLLGAGDAALSDSDVPRVVASYAAMARAPVVLPGGSEASPALFRALQMENELRGQLLLGSAAALALADYRSADDRDAALASVLAALDQLLPTMSDGVFQAAMDMRATLIEALLAQELAPAQVRDIVSALPATVLAHRLEIDEEVFILRNRVRHPLFVRGRVYG